MADRKILAVLTGDIVGSGRLKRSELEAVRSTLLDAIGEVKSWQRSLVRGKAEFFRGDAWQVLITDPALALRTGLYLRTALLAQGLADTRISIGLGTIDKVSP